MLGIRHIPLLHFFPILIMNSYVSNRTRSSQFAFPYLCTINRIFKAYYYRKFSITFFFFFADPIMTRLISDEPASLHASFVALRALAEDYEFNLCLNLWNPYHETCNVQLICMCLIFFHNIKLSHPVHFYLPKILTRSTCLVILPLLLVILFS